MRRFLNTAPSGLLVAGGLLWGAAIVALSTLGAHLLEHTPVSSEPSSRSGSAPHAIPVAENGAALRPLYWRQIVSGNLPHDDRERVVRVARLCLEGPIAGRRPAIRASFFPLNHCSCVAANAIDTFTADEIERLHGVLKIGRKPPAGLVGAWIDVVARCQRVPHNQRSAPFAIQR